MATVTIKVGGLFATERRDGKEEPFSACSMGCSPQEDMEVFDLCDVNLSDEHRFEKGNSRSCYQHVGMGSDGLVDNTLVWQCLGRGRCVCESGGEVSPLEQHA